MFGRFRVQVEGRGVHFPYWTLVRNRFRADETKSVREVIASARVTARRAVGQ
jgi:hypothetical protein